MRLHRIVSGALAVSLCAIAASSGAQQAPAQGERVHRSVAKVVVRGMGRGFIGVQVLPLTPELRTHFGVPEDLGILVSSVEDGGPADTAGIRVGDILSAVDGENVEGAMSLSSAIRGKKEGESVMVELYRDGGLQSFPVVVGERDRRVFDFGGDYTFRTEMPGHDVFIATDGLHLDDEAREAMQDAMRELGDRFDSAEWQERLQRFEQLDFSAIQERMKEVEKRLHELEEELEESFEKRKDGI